MNKKRNLVIAGAVALLLGLALLTPKRQSTTETINIPEAPDAPSAVKEADLDQTKLTDIKRITLEPEQVIFFNVPVETISVEVAIARINQITAMGLTPYIILDSPGGSVFDGARLISYMEGSKIPVITVCYGMCASMAAQIHQHGTKRYMIDRSILLFHQATGGTQGTVHQMRSLLNLVETEVNRLDAYIAQRSGLGYGKFKELSDQDLWISAKDAKNLNLSDGTVLVNIDVSSAPVFNVEQYYKSKNITIKKEQSIMDQLKDFK